MILDFKLKFRVNLKSKMVKILVLAQNGIVNHQHHYAPAHHQIHTPSRFQANQTLAGKHANQLRQNDIN